MEIFKELPFDLQENIYNLYETESKLSAIQEYQNKLHKLLMYEIERYQSTFWNEQHLMWSSDLLFFTLRWEISTPEYGFPSFI